MAEKTFAAQMLENLEAALLKLSKGTNDRADFNGQSYTKKDMAKLLEIRTKLQAEVASETNAATLAAGGVLNNRRVVTRFLDSSYGPGVPYPRNRPF